MSLLPSSPDVAPEGEPRVVGMDSEEADELMAALSSATARQLLAELHEEPSPPGELADRVDTSLQNAQYHLEKLEDAGAVEVVGTAYSEKGREMRVYGPADSPLVIFAGEEERASGLRAALSRLFGGFAALVVGSLAIQQLFGESLLRLAGDDGSANGGGGAPAAETATPAASPTPASTEAESGDGGDDAGAFTAGEGGTETTSTTATESSRATESGGATETVTDGGGSGGAETAGTATPDADGATVTSAPEPTGTPTVEESADAGSAATETPAAAADTVTDAAAGATPTPAGDGVDLFGFLDVAFGSGLPPGLAFFLGGATVLTLFVATTYLRARP